MTRGTLARWALVLFGGAVFSTLIGAVYLYLVVAVRPGTPALAAGPFCAAAPLFLAFVYVGITAVHRVRQRIEGLGE